jgi:hypothetical protein
MARHDTSWHGMAHPWVLYLHLAVGLEVREGGGEKCVAPVFIPIGGSDGSKWLAKVVMVVMISNG